METAIVHWSRQLNDNGKGDDAYRFHNQARSGYKERNQLLEIKKEGGTRLHPQGRRHASHHPVRGNNCFSEPYKKQTGRTGRHSTTYGRNEQTTNQEQDQKEENREVATKTRGFTEEDSDPQIIQRGAWIRKEALDKT